MKVTVYVREVDEKFLSAVAASGRSMRFSGWAYRALLEAAVAEAAAKGLPVPAAVREQIRRLRAQREISS